MTTLSAAARDVIAARHSDPFSYLGPHRENDETVVRVFLPEASQVVALAPDGSERALGCLDAAGLFAGPVGSGRYRLRARYGDQEIEFEDPYRFPPVLSDLDLHLLGEGNHLRLYDKLGAHPMEMDGVAGVAFVVWAPNARRVSVVGDFNLWDGRRHAMRVRGNGWWEIFVPGAKAGDKYKYEIVTRNGALLPLKSDPCAAFAEMRPATASIVVDQTALPRPKPARDGVNALDGPMSIYEVHLGSWRRKGERGEFWLDLSRARRTAPRLRRRHGLHPYRAAADRRASVRRLVGLSADRPVRADQPLRHAAGFHRAGRGDPRQGARPAARLGAGAFPRRSRTASPASTAPAFTSTRTRARAGISTGAR